MIYIDCGFWQGRALEIYQERKIVNGDWTIYAFEPNPDIEVEKNVKKFDLPIQLIKKAVWTSNGKVTFEIGGRPDSGSVRGTGGHDSPKLIQVESLDFSEFVKNLPDEGIICNMDIEGAEFPVLNKMIEEGTIEKISILEIEFHHRLVEKYTKEDAEELIDELVRHGVKVILKVPL